MAAVRAFIARINAGDPEGIVGIAAPGHLMVDAVGARLTGEHALREAWIRFFSLLPGYRIEPEEIFSDGRTVAVFGRASGSAAGKDGSAGPPWSVPAAWRAVVEGAPGRATACRPP